ncbi:MAG: hypothetical protein R3288_02100 [Woeseiaceae bacterium]|nr:hypothetical protein [Woeseiaceae bacterium]
MNTSGPVTLFRTFGGALALLPLTLLPITPATAEDAATNAKVERGRYLVTISGCNDCHTPWTVGPNGPEPDMTRMLSGHPQVHVMPVPPALPAGPWAVLSADTNTAFSGPWGISYTANLTPDRETGLGKWTFRNFKDTIRTGRHLGRGREILPPMPYAMYKHMTDEDLEAVFTYLQSIPAIKNKVPDPVPVTVAQN